ncbi:MAG: hypothetical protein AB1756_10110 [Acidobacteriota bacterium]
MFGCALVDYGCIRDWDQAGPEGHGVLVNTNGKAHVKEPMRVMKIFPDHAEEVLWFVDQAANGDQKLSNFINMEPAVGWSWHSDYYCNPDWNGCSWVSADRPYPKCESGYDYYPYTVNWNCTSQTFGFLWSTGRWRYGECGRNIPLADKISLLNMGELGTMNGKEGLYYNINRTNLTVNLENEYGNSWNVPFNVGTSFFFNPQGRDAAIDLANPVNSSTLKWYADWLDKYATDWTTVTVTYNGISDEFKIVGKPGFSSDDYRKGANKLY